MKQINDFDRLKATVTACADAAPAAVVTWVRKAIQHQIQVDETFAYSLCADIAEALCKRDPRLCEAIGREMIAWGERRRNFRALEVASMTQDELTLVSPEFAHLETWQADGGRICG